MLLDNVKYCQLPKGYREGVGLGASVSVMGGTIPKNLKYMYQAPGMGPKS